MSQDINMLKNFKHDLISLIFSHVQKKLLGVINTVESIISVQFKITINAPINLTAPCIIFSGGFFSLRGRFGAQKSRDSWAQSPEY